MQLHATVAVRDGAAFVLPARARRSLIDDQRRWRADGFRLVDRRLVDLDPAAGTITVPVSDLVGEHDAIEQRLRTIGIDHRPDASPPAGTLPIAAWVLPEGTLAGRVVEAAGQVVDRPAHDGVALIQGLAELLTGLGETTWTDPADVRKQLLALG